MSNWIESLKSLQSADLRIRGLKLKLTMTPKEKIELKTRALQNKKVLADVESKLKNTELKLKQNESKIADYKEQIAKQQQQSAMVKKNTEYQAMLKAIDSLKNKISEVESDSIILMDDIDMIKKALRQQKVDVDALNSGLKAEFKELEALENDLKKEIVKMEALRAEKAKKVTTDILDRYNSLLAQNSGFPLSKITNGICENCHLRITPQTLNSVMKKEVCFCDNCMHFIYMED